MIHTDDNGLARSRPSRPQDEALARAAQAFDEQQRAAEERRAAAAQAALDAEEAERRAAEAAANVERTKFETEAAERERENAARATAMVTGHKADLRENMSRYPDWVMAGKPQGRGPRRVLWQLWVVLRIYKLSWVPQPRPYGLYSIRAAEMSAEALSNRSRTQAIIAVATTKGGACKTTTATWRAAFRAWVTRLTVILFDTDSGGGKVLRRFGLDSREAMTSTEVVKRGGKVPYEELSRRTQTDPKTGVVMIHSQAGEEFEGDTLGAAIYELHRMSAHTVIVDCGPGFKKVNTDSVMRVSDVIVIPGDFGSGDDLDDIKETLDYPPYHLRGSEIGRVVIAVSAVKWRHFNTRTQYMLAKRFGVTPQQVVLIPYSRYLHKTGTVDLDRQHPKMQWASALLERRCGEAVIRHGRRIVPQAITQASNGSSAGAGASSVSVLHLAKHQNPTSAPSGSSATGWAELPHSQSRAGA